MGNAKARSLEERLAMLRAYSWSSYRGYAGLGEAAAFVEEAPILAMVEGAADKRRRSYKSYVELGIAERDAEFLGVLHDSRWGIGGEEYQESMRARHMGQTSHRKRGKGRGVRRVQSELTFHSLRHTATSLLKNAGASDAVAREIIGHDSDAISRGYTHIETDTLRKAVDAMPDILADTPATTPTKRSSGQD